MRETGDWLKAYMLYTQSNEAPEHFHFWVGVGVIGAALRRKAYIDMGDWQWHPNFYIILVAEPGIVNKSTTLRIGQALLLSNENIRFGPSSMTWQALIGGLAEASEAVPMPNGELVPMSCLSFFVSELGTCVDFDDRKMVDVLVDLWDGAPGAWRRATQTRGVEGAENPWLHIVAGTTPAWLADNLPRKMIGGGFASRCIWLHGARKKAYIAYPRRHTAQDQRSVLREQLMRDLAQIAALRGEFILTEEAYQYGEKWYLDHCRNLEQHAAQASGFNSYLSRKQAHVHKLAMILSAAKSDSMQIGVKELKAAIQIMSAVEEDYPKIFSSITTTVTMELTATLVRVVLKRQKLRKTELYQYFFRQLSAKDFGEALNSALEAQFITLQQEGQTIYVIPGPAAHRLDGTDDKPSESLTLSHDPVPSDAGFANGS